MNEALKRLRALHEAATPGPWKRVGEDVVEANGPGLGHPVAKGAAWDRREATAELIAAMRNALPSLLDIAEAAQGGIGVREDLRAALARLDGES